MIVGIDPGLKGGIAFIGEVVEVQDLPVLDGRINGKWLAKLLKDVSYAYIEKAGVRPGESGTSALTIGTNYGVILGVLMALDVPYEIVAPQTWKKALGVTCDPKATPKERKEKAVAKAIQLFPSVSIEGPRGGVKDGLAEALLIAEWGRRLKK